MGNGQPESGQFILIGDGSGGMSGQDSTRINGDRSSADTTDLIEEYVPRQTIGGVPHALGHNESYQWVRHIPEMIPWSDECGF